MLLFASVLLDASSKLRGRRQLALICAFPVAIEYATHRGQPLVVRPGSRRLLAPRLGSKHS